MVYKKRTEDKAIEVLSNLIKDSIVNKKPNEAISKILEPPNTGYELLEIE